MRSFLYTLKTQQTKLMHSICNNQYKRK